MMAPEHFRDAVLKPLNSAFREQPFQLHLAFSAVWSIDAYASHVSLHLHGGEKTKTTKRIGIEKAFKQQASRDCWQFRLIHEISNATKHALRNGLGYAVPSGDKVAATVIDGALWYYGLSEHYGEQIAVEIAWTFDDQKDKFLDGLGRVIDPGPTFSLVPVLDLLDPAVSHIDKHLGQ